MSEWNGWAPWQLLRTCIEAGLITAAIIGALKLVGARGEG